MPNKTIYIPDSEVPYWERAVEIAERRKSSISKIITTQIRAFLRDEDSGANAGLPIGFMPSTAAKDPRVLRREEAANDLRAVILEKLEELDESS